MHHDIKQEQHAVILLVWISPGERWVTAVPTAGDNPGLVIFAPLEQVNVPFASSWRRSQQEHDGEQRSVTLALKC
jgi:hypothetical protein